MRESGGKAPAPGRRALAVAVICAMLVVACSDDPPDLAIQDTTVSGADDAETVQDGAESGQLEIGPDGLDDLVPSRIRVDQFGYRPGDTKVAVIADPETGIDSHLSIDVGETIEVRRADDHEIVFEGAPEAWGDGEVHEQSGDRGWWFDFSSFDEPGSYYLVDRSAAIRSDTFDIDPDVYEDAFDAALRMFWFNRGNIDHPEELAGPWSDGPAFVGPGQDTEARSVDAQGDPSTARDLSGGWFDAGDPNKYVTYAAEPVHGLLTIYRRFPELFDDDLGITESGNGIPDIVDEIKWETDWLEKMQLDDGSVLVKVGLLGYGSDPVPSESKLPRYYEQACSSSTIAAAGMFANAALVFGQFPALAEDAARLQERAVRAFNWYQSNPIEEDCDSTEVKAGDADLPAEAQAQQETVAAIYLYGLTGSEEYHRFIRAGHGDLLPYQIDGFGQYGPEQADALLFYRTLPTIDATVVNALNARIDQLSDESELFGFDPADDLYRAHMPDAQYHWGSNRVKANAGAANLLAGNVPGGAERALAHLNYFHGVNPLGLVYLSNMEDLGAERSAQHIFHHWFGDTTDFDINVAPEPGVPPGYVVGGPNHAYTGNESPPAGQPVQKSYADWGAYDGDPAWEITEPAIYYQSAYLRLIASVLGS